MNKMQTALLLALVTTSTCFVGCESSEKTQPTRPYAERTSWDGHSGDMLLTERYTNPENPNYIPGLQKGITEVVIVEE
jgi:predicted component of type VI protein secretion system